MKKDTIEFARGLIISLLWACFCFYTVWTRGPGSANWMIIVWIGCGCIGLISTFHTVWDFMRKARR